jgi:Uma2 family endonuclease
MNANLQTRAERRMYFSGIPWQAYVALSDALSDQPGRITFDRGKMEIMSPSFLHENDKKRLGRFVETLTEALDIDIVSAGALTCRNDDVTRAGTR